MSDTTQIPTRAFDAAPPARVRNSSRVRDYVDLLKPRVMSLVVFTGLVGVLIAPAHAHPFPPRLAVLAIALGSGAAGAINMWYERDLDALMARTANRPLPAGRVCAPTTRWSLWRAAVDLLPYLLMAVATDYVDGGAAAAAILFYVVIYTVWLKPDAANIVIGGARARCRRCSAGRPSRRLGAGSALLFLIIFLWTPPHFWALALYRSDDYRRAGVPMLPVVARPRKTSADALHPGAGAGRAGADPAGRGR